MKRKMIKGLFPLAVLMMSGSMMASDVAVTNAKNVTDNKRWEALMPQEDAYDWMQMNSGEWLKGEFKSILNDEVEFDSDEFDLQKVDFKDVRQLRSSRVSTIHGDAIGSVRGKVMIKDQKIIVVTEEGEQVFTLDQVTSVLQGGDQEKHYWSAKVTLNLNVRSGNTDQIDYGAKAFVERRTVSTRFAVDYLGSFSSVSGETTAESQRVGSTFDIFQTRSFFWRPFLGEYYRDPFLNIGSKITLGVGAGYEIINTSKTEWSVNGGPAYQRTEFETVQANEDRVVTTPALLLGTRYNTEISKTTDFIYEYQLFLLNEESGLYTHHMIATFENEFVEDFDFDVSLVWDRIEKPATKSDNSTPDKDDYRLLIGVGYSY